jgi:hypothetical protein
MNKTPFVLTIRGCELHDAEGKQFNKWSDAYNAAIVVRKVFSDDILDRSERTQWSGNGNTACWQGTGPDGQARLIHIDPHDTGEPNPINLAANKPKMTQRDKMRELYHQHSGNKEATIEAYAKAEEAGEVDRRRNTSGFGTEQYAQALWIDGEKKGWLIQNKMSRLVQKSASTKRPKETFDKSVTETPDRLLRNFDHAPDLVMKLYAEALKAMNMEMPVSCAAVLRTMIEAICVDKGIVDGVVDKNFFNKFIRSSNLQGKINGLIEAGLVTQSHAEVLHLIRLLGNDAVHRAEASERMLLEEAIEIVESLIYGVYELPNKIGKFPNRAK